MDAPALMYPTPLPPPLNSFSKTVLSPEGLMLLMLPSGKEVAPFL